MLAGKPPYSVRIIRKNQNEQQKLRIPKLIHTLKIRILGSIFRTKIQSQENLSILCNTSLFHKYWARFKNFKDVHVFLQTQQLFLQQLAPKRESIQHLQKQPPKMLYNKSVLKNFVKFTGKHLFQVLSCELCQIFKKTFFHRSLTVTLKRVFLYLNFHLNTNLILYLHVFSGYPFKI